MTQQTQAKARPSTVLAFIENASKGRPRVPCRECGASRFSPLDAKRGRRGGKAVPLCRSCKAKPSDSAWEATLPTRFWSRRFPGQAAAGFRDAVLGVVL